MGNDVAQTKEELQNHLKEQLDFLKASAESYDNGFTGEAKRLAAVIRTLVHDTDKSLSLLKQLGLKRNKFFSTAYKELKAGSNQQRIGSYHGLIGIFITKGKSNYIPYLDEVPGEITGYVGFDSYWGETIFIDNNRNYHSRKDLVLSVANQDGGVHVDSELNEKYAKLSRQNSLGWMLSVNEGNGIPLTGAELAAIRQIAHELLRTLLSDYPQQKKLNKKGGMIIGGMVLTYGRD